MEAKDTVMSPEEQDKCTPTDEQLEAYLAEPDDDVAARLREADPKMFRIVGRCLLYGQNIAKAQAEISYKAGYDEAAKSSLTLEIGRKAGMKEVVEWINTHWWDRANYPEWQAFLKEDRDMIREQMADLQLKLDVGWVANCPVKIKQQGEKAIAEWKTDQLIIVLCAEIEKMGVKLTALPDKVYENEPHPLETKAGYLAGWNDGTEAQLQKILNKLKEGAE